MGGLFATQGHGDIQACLSAKGHVWVHALPKLQSVLLSVAPVLGHVLSKLQPVLLSVAPVTTNGCEHAQGLSKHLRSYWCLMVMLPPGSHK